MPSRNRNRKIFGGPQGPDAFIEIIVPTVDDNRRQQAIISAYQEMAADEGRISEANELIEKAAREYVAAHVTNWNWVDDDGAPLAIPSADQDVLGLLIREELDFIARALNGQVTEGGETKKLVKKS